MTKNTITTLVRRVSRLALAGALAFPASPALATDASDVPQPVELEAQAVDRGKKYHYVDGTYVEVAPFLTLTDSDGRSYTWENDFEEYRESPDWALWQSRAEGRFEQLMRDYVDPQPDALAKVRMLARIARSCDYDMESTYLHEDGGTSQTWQGVVMQGKTVCGGAAVFIAYGCQRYGIEARLFLPFTGHGCAILKVDGTYYVVDGTPSTAKTLRDGSPKRGAIADLGVSELEPNIFARMDSAALVRAEGGNGTASVYVGWRDEVLEVPARAEAASSYVTIGRSLLADARGGTMVAANPRGTVDAKLDWWKTLPSSEVTVTKVAKTFLSYYAHYDEVRTVKIPATVTSIEPGAFDKVPAQASFEVDPANPAYKSVNGALYTRSGEHVCGSVRPTLADPSSGDLASLFPEDRDYWVDLGEPEGTPGRWYVYRAGRLVRDSWVELNGDWYYLGSDGEMLVGCQRLSYGGKVAEYYFNPHHDGTYGKMSVGWLWVDGAWYWLNTAHDGTYGCVTKGWKLIDGAWYWFDADGCMATGWRRVDGSWYYFHVSGRMAANERVDGYTLSASGRLAA